MHVAFFLHTFPTLSETFIRNQITGLIDLGHKVTIFCHPNPDPESWELEDVKEYQLHNFIVDRKISIPSNKRTRALSALKLIKKHWNTNTKQITESLNFIKHGKKAIDLTLIHSITPFLGHQFDILQCHFGHIANEAIILKKVKFDFRFQVMFHGFDIRLGIDKDGIIYKDLIKHIDKVQAISKYNKKHLLEFGFPESKIVFHPVGIDLSKFTQKTNYIPGKTIQILSIGRLVLEKGYKYGIEAIAKLIHEQKVDLCYTIIGEGDLFHDLKNLCNKLNIEKIVRFEGAKGRNDIIRYLHNSDIFFLPSVAEALPVALMEALSCGLPTVATNVGSVKELVIDNENGFVSEPKSIDSIANRLVQLIEAKENWMEMGQSGHKHINANYNIKILNTKLIKK